MVQINFAQKTVTVKIVYYGPGMSGKTTNLEVVHQRSPDANRGDLTSIATDGDRTLFFDFMPLDLGTVAGMRTQFQIYTVPGQVYYNSTRKLVLQGVDGVIFIADSSASMVDENLESLKNLEENLVEYGKSLDAVPYVIQYNKRDLPDAMQVEELERVLNPRAVPSFEAVANSGQGVFPTLKALAALVLDSIHASQDRGAAGSGPAPAQPAAVPAPLAAAAPAAAPPVKEAGTGFYAVPPAAPMPAAASPPPVPNLAAQAQPTPPAPTPAAPLAATPPLTQPAAAGAVGQPVASPGGPFAGGGDSPQPPASIPITQPDPSAPGTGVPSGFPQPGPMPNPTDAAQHTGVLGAPGAPPQPMQQQPVQQQPMQQQPMQQQPVQQQQMQQQQMQQQQMQQQQMQQQQMQQQPGHAEPTLRMAPVLPQEMQLGGAAQPGMPHQPAMPPQPGMPAGMPPAAQAPYTPPSPMGHVPNPPGAQQPGRNVPAAPGAHKAATRLKPRSSALPTPKNSSRGKSAMRNGVFVALALAAGVVLGSLVISLL